MFILFSDEEKYEAINIDTVDTTHYDMVILSDYNLGMIHNPQTLIQKARIPVLVDPKGKKVSHGIFFLEKPKVTANI